MIKRGDIYMVNLGKVNGRSHVQKAMRPVLVISNNYTNCFSGIVNVIPISSKINKKCPSHVKINGYGLDRESILMVEQITTLDQDVIHGRPLGNINDKALLDDIVETIVKQSS